MHNCPSCGVALPDYAFFCSQCLAQTRCQNEKCGAVLEPKARGCVKCGTPLGERGAVLPTDPIFVAADPAFNIIEFEEDTKSRRFRAKVTDTAIDSVSHPLSIYLATGGGVMKPRNQRVPVQREIVVNGQQLLLPVVGEFDDHSADVTAEDGDAVGTSVNKEEFSSTNGGGTDVERLRDLFRNKDGKWSLDEPNLKVTKKKDYAQRLTYLFLYARAESGDESVPRADLNTILEDCSVNDGNMRAWLAKCSSVVAEGDKMRLNAAGRRLAREALEDVFTSARTEVWLPGEGTSSRGSKTSTSDGGDSKGSSKNGGGKGVRTPKIVTEWLSKWKAKNLNINGFDVLKNKKPLEQGIFGLWAIHEVAGDSGKIVTRGLLASFLYEAFTTQVDERSLERALKSHDAKGKVLHIEGTKFQITPDGITEAKKMAGVSNNANASAAKSPKPKTTSKK